MKWTRESSCEWCLIWTRRWSSSRLETWMTKMWVGLIECVEWGKKRWNVSKRSASRITACAKNTWKNFQFYSIFPSPGSELGSSQQSEWTEFSSFYYVSDSVSCYFIFMLFFQQHEKCLEYLKKNLLKRRATQANIFICLMLLFRLFFLIFIDSSHWN